MQKYRHFEEITGLRLTPLFIKIAIALILLLLVTAQTEAHVLMKATWEMNLQLLATGFTNSFFLMPMYENWRTANYLDSVIAFFTMCSSSMYHILETLDIHREIGFREHLFLGGNHGSWHRSDNIFAITSICLGITQILQLTDPMSYSMVRIIILSVATVTQCLSPWNNLYSVGPIIFTGWCVTLYCAVTRRWPKIVFRYLIYTLLASVTTVMFYMKGLDDVRDYLRLYHGCWHLSSSVGAFCLIRAFNPPEVVRIRRLRFGFTPKLEQHPPMPDDDKSSFGTSVPSVSPTSQVGRRTAHVAVEETDNPKKNMEMV